MRCKRWYRKLETTTTHLRLSVMRHDVDNDIVVEYARKEN